MNAGQVSRGDLGKETEQRHKMQSTVGPDLENKADCQSQQEKCTTGVMEY